MNKRQGDLHERLREEILSLSDRIAGSGKITAALACGNLVSDSPTRQTAIEVLLIIRGFQTKLMSYLKPFGERSILIIAVDEWVFERDVDRGFLGEALAWSLVSPHMTLINHEYLHRQEIKLKKRLITELMENLVLAFPQLSYELCIKPEYFVHEGILSRARILPGIALGPWTPMPRDGIDAGGDNVLQGYVEALRELERDGSVTFSDGYVRMSERFVDNARNPKVRLVNLSKAVPRTLFTSLLKTLPMILDIFSQNKETLAKLQRVTGRGPSFTNQLEVPERFVYIPTAAGLVPLTSKMSIEVFARRILHVDKETSLTIESMGGVLNNVYLVRASVDGAEKRVVVKRFRDWSSFKWFPLTLWSIGTRTFAVLGRSRLERECAMNQFLRSKGFAVPKLLHANAEEGLVFMEYVEGQNADKVIKGLAASKTAAETRKILKIIERIGKRFAKVHAAGIALGDTKPENIIIGSRSEIVFMDFEQSSRKGDMTWDVAEFLYFAGHDIPPLVGVRVAEMITEAFISGYLEAGGSLKIIMNAGRPKYTKVFSVLTLPHIMLAISNMCRKAEGLKE